MLHDYWLTLALCHTVSMSTVDNDASASDGAKAAAAAARKAQGLPPAKFFDGESPDEIAFVRAASEVGYIFEGSERNVYRLRTPYTDPDQPADSYTILAMNKFDHERRCMSVVVQCPGGSIKLLMKGADSAILPLAANVQDAAKHQKHVRLFAEQGLRTLAVGVKELPEKFAAQWLRTHNEAASNIDGRSEALSAAAKQIEQKVEILGVTAIEDKLQDNVAETIATLRAAQIKMWVLTGDMVLTAITIGYSSKMLSPDQTLLKYELKPKMRAGQNRARLVQQLKEDTATVSAALEARSNGGSKASFALVIDGRALHMLLGHMQRTATTNGIEQNRETDAKDEAMNTMHSFVFLARLCDCVLACRVSPSQKAQMVKLVRNVRVPGTPWYRPEPCTLAVGDGANDVAMIQAAHVGVGISGHEGRQAVNSSDFAIHEFHFLKRLLLIHGQWNYHRVCKLILYSFYKNGCFMWLQLFYSFETVRVRLWCIHHCRNALAFTVW